MARACLVVFLRLGELGHADGAKARIILAAAITGNLALLGYYKYADFFISNINLLGDNPMPLLHLALPLGISFFTFTQIAFLVDVHRKVAHEYSLVHYFLFVTYFPHLIALTGEMSSWGCSSLR